jgi:3-oxoadipyl-CoA thiolase
LTSVRKTKGDTVNEADSSAYICDAIRTPFGRYGGALAGIRTDDLAALPIAALVAHNPGVDWARVDDVYYGCANQAGEDNRNVARMAALLAGLPVEVPGSTINRLCGSSLDAVGSAARAIKSGEAQLLIAGGVESMTRAPFVMGKADSAFSRAAKIEDTTIGWRFVNPLMKAAHGIDSMPETAENVAQEFGISRADQDAFALRSQQRWAAAHAAGLFRDEIVPVTLPQGRRAAKAGEPKVVDSDEHPRPDTTLEMLAGLKGVVRPDGTVTAGNASGVNDGACAILLASAAAAAQYGLRKRARVLGMATAGLAPRIMGFGPAPASKKVLAQLGLSIGDMDVIELNEAFAAQGLAVTRDLGLADDALHVNPNGGAIAIGHPLGASGARLVLAALHQLERSGGRYALCTMCIGVGQGIALVIERVTDPVMKPVMERGAHRDDQRDDQRGSGRGFEPGLEHGRASV